MSTDPAKKSDERGFLTKVNDTAREYPVATSAIVTGVAMLAAPAVKRGVDRFTGGGEKKEAASAASQFVTGIRKGLFG